MSVFLEISETHGRLQLSIDDAERGVGYRIAGPKFDGTAKVLLQHKLDKRDVVEIRSYLRRVKDE